MQVNGNVPKSVPDPFQASWEGSPCISMDLAIAAHVDAAANAAAAAHAVAATRCGYSLMDLTCKQGRI